MVFKYSNKDHIIIVIVVVYYNNNSFSISVQYILMNRGESDVQCAKEKVLSKDLAMQKAFFSPICAHIVIKIIFIKLKYFRYFHTYCLLRSLLLFCIAACIFLYY